MPERVKEKLVELQLQADIADNVSENTTQHREFTADFMMANGVTVQEEAKLYWKPVKLGEWHLTCSACDSHLVCREGANFCPECGSKFVYPKTVAPQPPKGE